MLLGLAAEVLEQALLPHALHVVPVLKQCWMGLQVHHFVSHTLCATTYILRRLINLGATKRYTCRLAVEGHPLRLECISAKSWLGTSILIMMVVISTTSLNSEICDQPISETAPHPSATFQRLPDLSPRTAFTSLGKLCNFAPPTPAIAMASNGNTQPDRRRAEAAAPKKADASAHASAGAPPTCGKVNITANNQCHRKGSHTLFRATLNTAAKTPVLTYW